MDTGWAGMSSTIRGRGTSQPTPRPRSRACSTRPLGLPLNQGNIGSCTTNALCGALDSAPDNAAAGRQFGENDAVSLYECETEFEGRPYPTNDPGGSGLMVCRAAKQLGWISS
jgi:hypothetical protein